MKPPTNGGRLAHRIYLPQRHHEGVVNRIFSLRSVAKDAEGLTVERGPVAFEQYPEARRVSPGAARTRSASLSICPLNTRRPLSATLSVFTLDKMRGRGRKFDAGRWPEREPGNSKADHGRSIAPGEGDVSRKWATLVTFLAYFEGRVTVSDLALPRTPARRTKGRRAGVLGFVSQVPRGAVNGFRAGRPTVKPSCKSGPFSPVLSPRRPSPSAARSSR
jgi:hypothetical protein